VVGQFQKIVSFYTFVSAPRFWCHWMHLDANSNFNTKTLALDLIKFVKPSKYGGEDFFHGQEFPILGITFYGKVIGGHSTTY
jgi:hypothetical protein